MTATAYLLALVFFFAKVQLDNKYTLSTPQAERGVLALPAGALENDPLLFLRDGWAFYQYRFLTPADFARGVPAPTAYLFLGQYGGFELGDPNASPHGTGTYRLVVESAAPPPSYRLEMPDVHGRFSMWVNGRLLHDSAAAPSAGTRLDLPGETRLEIIVAVEDHSGLYTGMVYPPAFGLPTTVDLLLDTRLALSAALAAAGLMATAVCLFFFFSSYKRGAAGLFALLCLCFLCSIGQVLPHTFHLAGDWLVHLQRLGYYGAIGLVLSLQARYTGMSRRWRWVVDCLGVTLCVWVILFPVFLMGSDVSAMLFFSRSLGLYKLAAGFLLLAGGVRARRRGTSHGFFFGAFVFLCALWLDRVYPLYEPILLLWPIQDAILCNVLLVFKSLASETLRVYRDYLSGMERERSLRIIDEARQAQYRQMSSYIDSVRLIKHETHSFLLRLEYYISQKEYARLQAELQKELGDFPQLVGHTGHPLFDALLSYYESIAVNAGVAMTIRASRLPPALSIDDADLTGILANLLQNAVEAAQQVPAPQERYIRFSVSTAGRHIKLLCQNSKAAPVLRKGAQFETGKADRKCHGLGLAYIQRITEQYHGLVDISYQEDQFIVEILLPILPPSLA